MTRSTIINNSPLNQPPFSRRPLKTPPAIQIPLCPSQVQSGWYKATAAKQKMRKMQAIGRKNPASCPSHPSPVGEEKDKDNQVQVSVRPQVHKCKGKNITYSKRKHAPIENISRRKTTTAIRKFVRKSRRKVKQTPHNNKGPGNLCTTPCK